MGRKSRKVESRKKALEPKEPEPQFKLDFIKAIYISTGLKDFNCVINRYCRTQVFQFPQISFHPEGDEPHHLIYDSPPLQACVVSNLTEYFSNATASRHYAISPCLRHEVSETDEKIRAQNRHSVPVFLVIEEYTEFPPVEMIKGECNILDEIPVLDGEKVPLLKGGREGEQFIAYLAAADGAWPEFPDNQHLVNMILAGVRVGQKTPDPIPKYIDEKCLVTDDSRFVYMMPQLKSSARLGTSTKMDTNTYRDRVSSIKDALAKMKSDMGTPHMTLLINSMYCDEHGDDSYKRLQYLSLWQSLYEARKKCLGYHGDVKTGKEVMAGNKTLEELTDYRDEIAHWWTDTIDENYLSDLQKTINEMIHRKYF